MNLHCRHCKRNGNTFMTIDVFFGKKEKSKQQYKKQTKIQELNPGPAAPKYNANTSWPLYVDMPRLADFIFFYLEGFHNFVQINKN